MDKPNEISAGTRWLGLALWLLLTYSASATAVFVSTNGWKSPPALRHLPHPPIHLARPHIPRQPIRAR